MNITRRHQVGFGPVSVTEATYNPAMMFPALRSQSFTGRMTFLGLYPPVLADRAIEVADMSSGVGQSCERPSVLAHFYHLGIICSSAHIALQMKSFRCLSLLRELHMSHEAPCVHARTTVAPVANPRNLLIPNECTAHTMPEVFAPCLSFVVVEYPIRQSLFQWRPTVSRSAQPIVSASTEDSF